jgi:hypothetical protein
MNETNGRILIGLSAIIGSFLFLSFPLKSFAPSPHSKEPRVETFAFVHRETTGITSYVTVRGKQKPIIFRADSDSLAVKSLHALNWRIFLPNSNGQQLFLVGQYFGEPKQTPTCSGCAATETYSEFRLIEWYIVVPFKVVREDCDNCPYMVKENLRTKRNLELSDFQDFDGRNSMDVRRFQREKGSRRRPKTF